LLLRASTERMKASDGALTGPVDSPDHATLPNHE
jgi:hypothetical protein